MIIRTRIKFCGITRVEDAVQAVRSGVDAIGLILVPESRRSLTLEQAALIRNQLPPFVTAVALLRNPSAARVREVIAALTPDLLQFHGEETPEFCDSFGVRYVKAIPMNEVGNEVGSSPGLAIRSFRNAAALLFDGHAAGALGGQGERFDWSRLRVLSGALSGTQPLIVAGGLDADNVAEAIRTVRPFAVDVASGIEADPKASPGYKDSGKMADFARAVAQADREFSQVSSI